MLENNTLFHFIWYRIQYITLSQIYRKYLTKQFHSIEGNIFPNYIDELKTSLIISQVATGD